MKGSEKLKGKLLKAILVMCLCLMPAFGVGAATNDSNNGTSDNLKKIAKEETEKDDLNRYRTGKVGFSYFNRNDGKQCSKIWVFSPNKGSNVSYMYAVKDEYGALLIYGRGSVHCDIETIKNPDSNGPESSSGYNDWSLSLYDGGKGKGFFCSAPSDENKTMTYYTNIPIFSKDNLDAIKAYEESGDISGAENEYDISQPDQDDSVELPKNVRTYGNVFETALRQASLQGRQVKYNAMTVRWDPPEDVESYSYDVKIQCTYSITSNSNLSATGRIPDLTKSETTSAVMIVTDYPYANRGIYDLTTGKEIARGENQPEDCVINEESLKKLTYSCDFENVFPTKLKIWIRNRKGNKCSNWVAVTSNASQVAGSDSKASVEDDNGNKIDNDTYNDTPIDNSDKHTYYDTDPDTSSSESPKFSLKEFYSYLKSGFGLLGNNGLIAFFAKSFSFIPSNIWSLITGGVAVMIIVGIIKFALKR